MSKDSEQQPPGGNPLVELDHEPTFFIDISEEDLERVLAEHLEWVNSSGQRGKRANLERVNLVGADLHGVNLTEANLCQANLSKANLQGAGLSKANLQGAMMGGVNLQKASLWDSDLQSARLSLANLQGANLSQANLYRANLRESNLQGTNMTRAYLHEARLSLSNMKGARLGRADLQDATLHHAVLYEANLQEANLHGVRGLQIRQLRGANMSSAQLPAGIEDTDWLKHVEETSRKGSRLFLIKLLCCLYAWLVVSSTQDVHLITNMAVSPLPLIGTKIPIASFFWVVPLILSVLFIYFHLYMQRLWEDLAAFPAVFPDGKPLDKKVYPWLMTGIMRAHIPHLRDSHLPFFDLQKAVTILVGWCIVPMTLAYFAFGYLVKADALGSAYHFLLLVGCCAMSYSFYTNAVSTMQGQKRRKFSWREAGQDSRARKSVMIAAVVMAVWGFTFFGPISLPQANLASMDLLGADLNGVNLQGATLDGTDFRAAHLRNANLRNSTMFSAQLDNADLAGADLAGADLKAATFIGTNFTDANLDNVDLRGAQLDGAIFTNASFRGANLARAQLKDVKGLTSEQLCQAETMIHAMLDAELVGEIMTNCVTLWMGTQEN
ncbi:MAG: pentapeptide repeat-containing protein [Rhodothermales bacterium]